MRYEYYVYLSPGKYEYFYSYQEALDYCGWTGLCETNIIKIEHIIYDKY